MSCKFCSGERNQLDSEETVQLFTTLKGRNLEIYYSAYSGDSDIDTHTEINYCPMCGRKLKDVEK